jgi:hypothetical protein
VKQASLQVDLVPTEAHRLTDAQAVPVHQEKKCAVAGAVPASLPGSGEETLNFIGHQVLAAS